MKTVTDLLQSQPTRKPFSVAQNAAMTSSSWYQLGMQMALPLILQGEKTMNTISNQNGSHVLHVENKSIQGETGGENIATKRADKQPTENGEKKPRYGDMVTQHANDNGRYYIPSGFTRNCNHCGQEYTAKRDTSKFCTRRCRVAAHRARGNK